jgi:hypothetical protein
MVIGERRKIAPDRDIWRSVLEATGQPPRMSKIRFSQPRRFARLGAIGQERFSLGQPALSE